MSRFLITYGPDPKVYCPDCHGEARMAQHFPHSPRPADFKAVERVHVCGPGPWDVAGDLEPEDVSIGAVP